MTDRVAGVVAMACNPPNPDTAAKSEYDQSNFFLVTLRSGSVIRVEVENQDWQWTELAVSGDFRDRTVNSRQINQIFVGKEAISQQVLEIRKWIEQLSSDDFLTREAAEKALASSNSLPRFRSLIINQQEHPNFEVRYRSGRILEAQKRNFSDAASANSAIDSSFDILVDLEGKKMSGDLGEWEMVGRFRNQNIRLRREQISKLSRMDQEPQRFEQVDEATDVLIRVFHDFREEFYLPHQTLIDFEESTISESLAARTDVSQMYLSQGLKLNSEKPGYIGISGYMFRGENPPQGNSICVFEVGVNTFHRFKGVMEFRFCVPDFPELTAGVHEFGLFAARIDNPRDFILEAYNAEGHLIAMVEAADTYTPFFGIKSSEPITFLRLRSNPFLFRLTRKIDEDFCVDDVFFSKPVPMNHLRQSRMAPAVLLRQGDLLAGEFKLAGSQLLIQLQDLKPHEPLKIDLPLDEIRSVRFANEIFPFPKGNRTWAVMLEDRTILHLQSENHWVPKLFAAAGDQVVNPVSLDKVVAIWLASNEIRYPIEGDFSLAADVSVGDELTGSIAVSVDPLVESNGEGSQVAVMVYPTCRIISKKFDLNRTGYRWSAEERKEQDVWIRIRQEGKYEQFGPGGKSYEDPNPQLDSIDFEKTSPELIPTLWLQRPPERRPHLGMVQLVDGQQIILGGSAGFELESIDSETLIIRWKNRTQKIPFGDVVSIDFE